MRDAARGDVGLVRQSSSHHQSSKSASQESNKTLWYLCAEDHSRLCHSPLRRIPPRVCPLQPGRRLARLRAQALRLEPANDSRCVIMSTHHSTSPSRPPHGPATTLQTVPVALDPMKLPSSSLIVVEVALEARQRPASWNPRSARTSKLILSSPQLPHDLDFGVSRATHVRSHRRLAAAQEWVVRQLVADC